MRGVQENMQYLLLSASISGGLLSGNINNPVYGKLIQNLNESAVSTWLYRVALNAAIDLVRKESTTCL